MGKSQRKEKTMKGKRAGASELIRAIERIKSKGVAIAPDISGDIDVLRDKNSTSVERKAAVRKLSSVLLERVMERVTMGDDSSLVAIDVCLRVMRFIVDVDKADDVSKEMVDPVDLLAKLTGLGREEIISLYHRSSIERFSEVREKTRAITAIPRPDEANLGCSEEEGKDSQ